MNQFKRLELVRAGYGKKYEFVVIVKFSSIILNDRIHVVKIVMEYTLSRGARLGFLIFGFRDIFYFTLAVHNMFLNIESQINYRTGEMNAINIYPGMMDFLFKFG